MSLDGFVKSTPREDENAPAPPRGSIGKLPKGLRPESIPRGPGELSKYVSQWDGWGAKQKNTGSEQFRYLVRTMFEIEGLLKSGEKTISDFKAQLRGWRERVKEQDAAAFYDTNRAGCRPASLKAEI